MNPTRLRFLAATLMLTLLVGQGSALADGFGVNHDWTISLFGHRTGLVEKALASDFDNTVYNRVYLGGKVLQLGCRIEYVVVPALFAIAGIAIAAWLPLRSMRLRKMQAESDAAAS